jgi:predicted RNA-binding protein YlxR (DUF448 family)
MPTRSCRICRARGEKATLTRWVVQDGKWVLDDRQRLEGRGVYTDSDDCAVKLQKGNPR